ncbi:putative zinc finger protein [Cucumis melo var. makuwa]|uniref:RING-type E3 ubiquitin transferase n=1 Tax=Cucumis melo var. makuwa TaxID=1194695 RepID=A0A5A7SMI7_CUCMM|nr:putative zinc finger protein [Cucumis melo var. makuwa]
MAEQNLDACMSAGYYMGMSLRITDPDLRHRQPQSQIQTQPNSPALVKQIDLNFKLQVKCQHFGAGEEGSTFATTLLSEHIISQPTFPALQLPISIFKRGDKTLKRLLFQKFQMFRGIVNVELVVDEIIKHWIRKVEEDQENSSRVFAEIYPLEIRIELLVCRMIPAIIDQPQEVMMVPTSDNAMESMLKRVENNKELMKLGDDSIDCVICLEKIGKEEKRSGRVVLQMPCLHMFHEECIRKWLKTSHFCPTCRFSMPINN